MAKAMKNLRRAKGYVVSKTEKGECKNDDCRNSRRDKSAFCDPCSRKYKAS